MAKKLELTWYGKDEPIIVEPRLLIENPEISNTELDPETGNMLIHGDNLLALKALEQKFTGKVKCIYIDPPYNTGEAFDDYDDNLEHSIWLNLMRSRLEIMRGLLAKDGYIFIQIDDNEVAYLTVLMDEIFGRRNHVNTICVNMNSLSGVKMTHAINGKRFPAQKEYILLYKKGEEFSPLKVEKSHKDKWDKEYNLIIPQMGRGQFEGFSAMDDESANSILAGMDLISLAEYASGEGIELTDEWKWENAYRIFGSKSNKSLAKRMMDAEYSQVVACYTNTDGNKRFFRTDYNKNAKDPRIELVQAESNSSVFLSDNWIDISNDGGVAQEGGVILPKGKKPERLVARIIKCSTDENDIVLDSFLGSGTTAAVAHKLKRRWIGVELNEQAYTHCIPRLNKVIAGNDTAGCTADAGWEGGGGYRFYELAPSLINKDAFGEEVINDAYDADMLAAAVALHEGFDYQPDGNLFWKQAKSTENAYLFVTTRHVSMEYLDSIKDTMEGDEFLIIACKSFDEKAAGAYKQIVLKKIPQILLGRCEFGKGDYNLNIIHPPVYEEEDDE